MEANNIKVNQYLKNQHILTTHTMGNQTLGHLLEKEGAVVTNIPLIEIQPLKIGAIKQKACYQADTWVFLRQHGIKSNDTVLKKIHTDQEIIAIGPGTKSSLEDKGLTVDQIPISEFNSHGIAKLKYFQEGMPKKVLVFSESSKPKTLCSELKSLGHEVHHIPTYSHKPIHPPCIVENFKKHTQSVSYITTHSQKGLLHLLTCIKQNDMTKWYGKNIIVTCQKMFSFAKKSNFRCILQSQDNSAKAIIQTLINHRRKIAS